MAMTIHLSDEDEQRIDALVEFTGGSKEFYVRELVERGLEDIEDYYRGNEILKRVRKGEIPVYSDAEVRADLGLGG